MILQNPSPASRSRPREGRTPDPEWAPRRSEDGDPGPAVVAIVAFGRSPCGDLSTDERFRRIQ
ncbi:hypothetical protein CV102_25010 [Natronococcus pandeyae]|uniref:Uncharacterized protein n=1 Tax=Natronococcus pandeyae TaxID=2055836 RepID=A0A8J8PZX9_9EURY|nr:hypothetical protein CV102_25010 [Natronococcus pandeyae]